MDTRIMGTSSVMSTEDAIDAARIMVSNPSKRLVLPLEPEKIICISFDGCVIPLYECLFTQIIMWLPWRGT